MLPILVKYHFINSNFELLTGKLVSLSIRYILMIKVFVLFCKLNLIKSVGIRDILSGYVMDDYEYAKKAQV